MAGIALAGFFLGHLADSHGRKSTIVAGLTLFALSSYLFAAEIRFGTSRLYWQCPESASASSKPELSR